MVQYLHFRILKLPLIFCSFPVRKVFVCRVHPLGTHREQILRGLQVLQVERSSMPTSQRQATGVDTRRKFLRYFMDEQNSWDIYGISWDMYIFIHYEIGITSWISLMEYFLVGGLECHHPNWRTHIFQRGRYTTNQFCFLKTRGKGYTGILSPYNCCSWRITERLMGIFHDI